MATSSSGVTKYFSKPQEGFSTTTSGSVSSGATSVGLSSTGNYANGDVVVLIIEPGVSGKEQSFTGTMDTGGAQVTGVVWTSGTNSAHSGGVTVVDYVAAAHLHMMSTGILKEHDQDGTHAAITAASADFTGAVSTDTISEHTAAAGVNIDSLNIKDGYVTGSATTGIRNASLGTEAGGLGAAWQNWTPSWTNFTTGNGTLNYAKYIQIGKTVHFRLSFTLGTTSAVATGPYFSAPVNTNTGYAAADNINAVGQYNDASGERYMLSCLLPSANNIALWYHNATATSTFFRQVTATVPVAYASTDVITVAGSYEAV